LAGRSHTEALDAFLEPVRRSLSCVAERSPTVTPNRHQIKPETPLVLVLAPIPVPLRGDSQVSLLVTQHFRIVRSEDENRGPWKVRTSAYLYAIVRSSDEKEILSYHWHPDSRSPITFPHLHISEGAECRLTFFHRAHLPTGRVSLEKFLWLLIADFGVEPLRADWEHVLAEADKAFAEYRTWA